MCLTFVEYCGGVVITVDLGQHVLAPCVDASTSVALLLAVKLHAFPKESGEDHELTRASYLGVA